MTLEPLGKYFQRSEKGSYLDRIYKAHLLQQQLQELLGEEVKVSARAGIVKLICNSEQLALLAKMKRTKILALSHRLLAKKELKLQIVVRQT